VNSGCHLLLLANWNVARCAQDGPRPSTASIKAWNKLDRPGSPVMKRDAMRCSDRWA
jgi:hypothetical protein